MFDVSEVASSTSTSVSSTSLGERPRTHCFQSKWALYVHIIGSKVGTLSRSLHLSARKTCHHVAPSDAGLFSAAVSEDTVTQASSIMDYSLYHYRASVQMAALQRKASLFDSERLTLRHGLSDLSDTLCYQTPIDAVLEIS